MLRISPASLSRASQPLSTSSWSKTPAGPGERLMAEGSPGRIRTTEWTANSSQSTGGTTLSKTNSYLRTLKRQLRKRLSSIRTYQALASSTACRAGTRKPPARGHAGPCPERFRHPLLHCQHACAYAPSMRHMFIRSLSHCHPKMYDPETNVRVNRVAANISSMPKLWQSTQALQSIVDG